jgi:feruloyl-CoA synthase
MSVPLPPLTRFETRADGALLVRALEPLGRFARCVSEPLARVAAEAPARAFLAERPAPGAPWRRLTYGEAFAAVRAVGEALLDRGLGPDTPVAVLSGNSIAHALLGLAAMHVGIPWAAISPAYALAGGDLSRLRAMLALLGPGLVFAEDAARFAPALAALPPGVPALDGAGLDAMRATPPGRAERDAASQVGPDSVAKVLFTSGSTAAPKGVVTTQRMLCSNQQVHRQAYGFLAEGPPVFLDWLPWSHCFGGSVMLGLALFNGGTLHIDHGRPTPEGIGTTLANLRDVTPTALFNVPRGYAALLPGLRDDRALAARVLGAARMLFHAGAGLSPALQAAWDDLARQVRGTKLPWMSALGATETGPTALLCRPERTAAGHVGLPVPGCTLKLVPVDGLLEARLAGPNVTPGYWRDPGQTAAAFDADGFWRTGDALRPADPADPQAGFVFDGRIAEDFKLATGTWVRVGALRAALLAALAPLLNEVVIAAPDREEVALLGVPDAAACAALCPPGTADPAAHPAVAAALRAGLQAAGAAQGSAARVRRIALLRAPLSLDAGELTDKGTVNQRAVLARRAALVDALYAAPPGAVLLEP